MRSFLPSCIRPLLKRFGAIALMMMGASLAASAAEPAVPQTVIDAFSRANAAVVGVRASATEGSRSAETLGKQRIGSGVVIGPDGLILTIGYLMLEAQSIQITTQDNKTLPAKAVAYDLATGFGLIQPLLEEGEQMRSLLMAYLRSQSHQPELQHAIRRLLQRFPPTDTNTEDSSSIAALTTRTR